MYIRISDIDLNGKYLKLRCANLYFKSLLVRFILTGDTYRFTTYQDARRVRLVRVDGLTFETNIL